MKILFHLSFLRTALVALALFRLPILGRAEEFRLFSTRMPIPEGNDILAYVLISGTNRFTFLPPPTWTIAGRPDEKKVVLASRDLAASIILRLHNETTLSTNDVSPEILRRKLMERYPDAKIAHEFPGTVARRPAFAFDLESLVERRLPVFRRAEFVALPAGTVEFELTVSTKNVTDYYFAFGNFVGSFQVDESPAKK